MMTRVFSVGAGMLTPLARTTLNDKRSANPKAEERNIRVLILTKPALSRSNWGDGSRRAEAEFRRPRHKGRERHIQKPALEQQQKRYRQELAFAHGEPDEVAEIKTKSQLSDRQGGFQRAVFATAPGLRFPFDAVLWRSGEIGLMVEDGF